MHTLRHYCNIGAQLEITSEQIRKHTEIYLDILRLLVFEDIDAIFGKDREKLLTDSVLTFSGHGRDIGTMGLVPFQLLEVSDVSFVWEFQQICKTNFCALSEWEEIRRFGKILYIVT